MAKYACSEEGVEQLKAAATKILEGAETIKNETNTMRAVADEYSNTLGPHRSQLSSALDGIAGAVSRCLEPANNVAEKLQSVATKYEGVIANSPFGTGGN